MLAMYAGLNHAEISAYLCQTLHNRHPVSHCIIRIWLTDWGRADNLRFHQIVTLKTSK